MADKDKGEVPIHGKTYLTVARRVDDFRKSEEFKGWSIETELVSAEDSMVVMKSTIRDSDGKVAATGYAEEDRSFGKINKTSALENCETSAVGRALAFLGLGGTEIASADEVATAIAHGSLKDSMEPILKHNDVVRENIDSIHFIKEYIKTGDVAGVAQIWLELSNEIKEALWVAPTKGGVFTTEERKFLKSDEFAQARKEAA